MESKQKMEEALKHAYYTTGIWGDYKEESGKTPPREEDTTIEAKSYKTL